MKRTFILLTIALFTVGSMLAEEKVLIDFTKIVADTVVGQAETDADGNEIPNENEATLVDYTNGLAGSNLTQDQERATQTSLAPANWTVTFTSSSRTVASAKNSFVKEATSKSKFGENVKLLGVRIQFPIENFNSKAYIKPPFEIPAFEPSTDGDGNPTTGTGLYGSKFEGPLGDDGKPTGGLGVIKNVGTIKSVAVDVYGLNFPYELNAIFLDQTGAEHIYPMGSLKFDGWGRLTWNNPKYIENIRNREVRIYPIYPTNTPFIKFAGFRIDRPADQAGGDFLVYFKEVRVVYDKALEDLERDIDDESEWKIIQTRENAKKAVEMQGFGATMIQKDLEKQRQATESYYEAGGANVGQPSSGATQ